MNQIDKGKQVVQPFVDSWDKHLHDILSKNMCFALAKEYEAPGMREYKMDKEKELLEFQNLRKEQIIKKERKDRRYSHSKENMFGLIVNSDMYTSPRQPDLDLGSRIYKRLKKMRDNRTPFRLVDLHELCLCSGRTPNELLNITSISNDIVFLTFQDLLNMRNRFRHQRYSPLAGNKNVSVVVRTSPILGLSLIAKIYMSEFRYEVIDLIGNFQHSKHYSQERHQISPDFHLLQSNFNDLQDPYSLFSLTNSFYEICLAIAKGLSIDEYGRPFPDGIYSNLIGDGYNHPVIDILQNIQTSSGIVESAIQSINLDRTCILNKQNDSNDSLISTTEKSLETLTVAASTNAIPHSSYIRNNQR